MWLINTPNVSQGAKKWGRETLSESRFKATALSETYFDKKNRGFLNNFCICNAKSEKDLSKKWNSNAEENQYGSKNTKIKWQKKPLETA